MHANNVCACVSGVNPLKSTRSPLCDALVVDSLVVVLVHPDTATRALVASTAYALGLYHVPVISVSGASVQYSDKVGSV
jgi:hypothetical protein